MPGVTKTPITQHHPRDVSAGNSLEEVILINNGPIGRRGLGVVALRGRRRRSRLPEKRAAAHTMKNSSLFTRPGGEGGSGLVLVLARPSSQTARPLTIQPCRRNLYLAHGPRDGHLPDAAAPRAAPPVTESTPSPSPVLPRPYPFPPPSLSPRDPSPPTTKVTITCPGI